MLRKSMKPKIWTLNVITVIIILTSPRYCSNQLIIHTFRFGSETTYIQDHVCQSTDVIRTIQTLSDLHCSYICATNQTCLGYFYHHGDRACVTCNQLYSDTNGLAASPGMIYHRLYKAGQWNEWSPWTKCTATCGTGSRSRTRTCDLNSDLSTVCFGVSQENDNSCNKFSCSPLAKTCADWSTRGMSESDMSVNIDPDGSGAQFGTVTVACDFDSEPGKAITVLHHNQEARTLVDGFETCGSYSVQLSYTAGNEEAKMVADLSTSCTQYLKWECHHSEITWPGNPDICLSWKNRNMVQSSYFTGPHPSGKYCTCGEYGNCSTPSYECNCDTNDQVWRFDDGNVTNKDDLPITEFSTGDTGDSYEMGYHTIGPMYCH